MFALSVWLPVRVSSGRPSVIPGAPAGLQAGISPWHYLLTQGAVICRYLQLLVVPYGFTVDPDISVPSLAGLAAWAAAVGRDRLAGCAGEKAWPPGGSPDSFC